MQTIHSAIHNKVCAELGSYDERAYTATEVQRVLEQEHCSVEGLKTLLSSAAAPYLEAMATKAKRETSKHFGNTVYVFTPLYISNYCDNNCVYCGFNCCNKIARKKLSMAEIEHEMQIIADSGIEEVLLLTGESAHMSPLSYICDAIALGKQYFRTIGLEIYPVDIEEYRMLHAAGADYVTVFQETYDTEIYKTLHLAGRKKVFEYRFDAQERAVQGGMRGVGLSALFGLADWRKDALATALHAYYLQRAYPATEISLSCPRLRPASGEVHYKTFPVSETELCQIICAYRIFLPFAGITISSREQERFRNGIMKIAATKVSAGVSTGIGDHEYKYTRDELHDESLKDDATTETSEQFEIADERSFSHMYDDIQNDGLQPVLTDYLYV
jgi:2-iminoacetate synthase